MGSSDQPEPPSDRFIVPFPFPVVDAAVYDWAMLVEPTMGRNHYIKRTQITTGTVEYALGVRFGEEEPGDGVTVLLGTIVIKAIALEQTYVGAEYGRNNEEVHIKLRMAKIIPSIVDFIYDESDFMKVDAALLLRRPTPSRLTPAELATFGVFNSTAPIPPIPDPDQHGWEATLEWKDKYGKATGVVTDGDLARYIMKDEKTIRNRRSQLGMSRRNNK